MKLSRVGATLTAAAIVALVVACDDPPSRSPTSPGAPFISGVVITGPDSVAPGQSAQFTASIGVADGNLRAPTTDMNLRWRSSNTLALTVTAAGLVTARQLGDSTLTAEVTVSGSVRQISREVVVVPDGTYPMVGMVVDAAFPTERVGGARVEVESGPPLFATTNSSGEYRLYGVPPDANVHVTSAGYSPLTLSCV